MFQQTPTNKPEDFYLIVAGGRNFTDYDTLVRVLLDLGRTELKDKLITIVSGMARGADQLGARFAHEMGVELHEFPANWYPVKGGPMDRAAGIKRNVQMAEVAHGVLAFWDGISKGTHHMIDTMRKQNKSVWVHYY